MTDILTNVLAFAFALGVIIFVHESGHLMMAKAFGVRVLTFSLGFGKSLWGFRRGETEYRVSALPLGGYVRLGGENAEEATGDPREFVSKPRWQRVLVYLAGPLMNVVLAIVLFAGLFMVGIAVPNLPGIPSVVGAVEPGSSAAKAGLQRGDRIVAAKGEPVTSWKDLGFALLTSPGQPVALVVERGATRFNATVTPVRDPKYAVGDSAGIYPSIRPQVTEILPNSPAAAAGFRTGDEIRAVDGRPIADSQDFVAYVDKRAGQRIDIQVVRDAVLLTVPVTPRNQDGHGRIGVGIGFFQRYGPRRALIESLKYNVQIVQETFRMIGKVFTREISARAAFAGPVEIAAQSGAAARTGFKFLLHLMGFISISIAILNLMPIPILDGGQIFILLIEVLIRRDLSLRLKEVVSQVGFVLILLLMFVVIWFDVSKHLPASLLPGS
ncbi:MAG TPA: RIP metalloprotease RseP [Thermoanaerobaculia bacterium]|nr:RIP metalloprotease RseP [Thermoanaerobaculia bacterium]